jgi:hypothetical protein
MNVNIAALGALEGEPMFPAVIGNIDFRRHHSATVECNGSQLEVGIELCEHMELESRKAPLDLLVIEHAEKTPTAN